jgi:hypothetical protein
LGFWFVVLQVVYPETSETEEDEDEEAEGIICPRAMGAADSEK